MLRILTSDRLHHQIKYFNCKISWCGIYRNDFNKCIETVNHCNSL